MRNSFTFYRSFMEGLEDIPAEAFKRLVLTMAHYAMDDTDPELEGLENALFLAWKANIDASNRRKDNGLKGGRPKSEVTETETENNRNKPNETERENPYKDKREIEIKDKEKEKTKAKEKAFVRPALEDVQAYCRERNNGIDAQHFFDFYQSKGWKVGNQTMKDWRACVRTWEKRANIPKPSNKFVSGLVGQRYDMDAIERELEHG